MKKTLIIFSLLSVLFACTDKGTVTEDLDKETISTDIRPLTYHSKDLDVHIQPVREHNLQYWVSTIKVKDATQLKASFATDTFSSKTEITSKIAKKKEAIFAVNGADVAFKSRSLVIRNDQLYRNSFPPLEIRKDGTLFIGNGNRTAEQMLEEGAVHTYDFGPALIINGQESTYSDDSWFSSNPAPRTAIGQRTSYEYMIVTVDGRSEKSAGMTFSELTALFKKAGAKWAYNLDGGGSTTLYFKGQVLNNPSDGRERPVSDILYLLK